MKIMTHEQYIKSVKELVYNHANNEDKERIANIKLVYGAGHGQGARGMTIYNRWQHTTDKHSDLVEICAMGEENHVQLAGTTVHELAHVISGLGQGHNGTWKENCDRLGLRKAMAAGMQYHLAHFAPWLRFAIAELPKPNDGKPHTGLDPVTGQPFKMHSTRGCTLGYGTKGGKSRGTGSGSRLRLYHCSCIPPVKARVASDTFDATCNVCRNTFKREVK